MGEWDEGLDAEQVKVAAVPAVVLTEEGAVVISENIGVLLIVAAPFWLDP